MAKPARTCCPTHTDNCRRNLGTHLWAGPYRVTPGSPEDHGDSMSHPDDLKCAYCGGTCTADRELDRTGKPIPRCPLHPRLMTAVPPATQEQAWVGQWYECEEPDGCTIRILNPSQELLDQNKKLAAK